MRNTDSESDAESDANAKSVVVDESADSVVWKAVKPDVRLRTRNRLESCQTSDSGRETALNHARRQTQDAKPP